MSERVTVTELADEFGLSRGRVAGLLREAGVERDHRKLYDEDHAQSVLSAAIDPAIAAGNRAAGRGPQSDNAAVSELAAAKAASERERTRKLSIANAQAEGRLVSRDDAIKGGSDFAIYLRNDLLSLGAKCGPQLVGRTEVEMVAIINAEVRRALACLADIDNFILSGSST